MVDATAASAAAQRKGIADVAADQEKAARDALGRYARRGQAASAVDAMEAAQHRGFMDRMTAAGLGLGKVAAGYATLGNAAQIVGTISSMWEAQRKDIEASVGRLGDMREKMLELAALKDRLGRTTPELADQIAFRAQTLQSPEQARVFQAGALNTGQSSIKGGFVAKDQFDEAMKHVASYQAATNADPNAIGNLTGALPTMIGKQNQTAEEIARRGIGIFQTMVEGGSNLGPAIGQFNKNAALVGPGMFASPEQMAAVQSALSVNHPDDAGTLARQYLRGTVGGLTRMRGSQFEGSIPQSEYLAGLGATDQNDAVQIGKMIAADMAKQQVAESAKGRTFNPSVYLTTKGYTDEEARTAVLEFAGQINSGKFAKTFEPRSTPASAPAFADAMKPVQEAQRLDPLGLRRAANVAGDAADVMRAGGASEFYDSMRRLAFANLKADPKNNLSGSYEEWSTSATWGGPIIDEAKRLMDVEARRVGVKPPEPGWGDMIPDIATFGLNSVVGGMFGMGTGRGDLGGSPMARLITSDRTRAGAFFDYGNEIKAAGGNPGNIKELIDEMKRNTAVLLGIEEANKRQAAPGPQKAPPPVRSIGP